MESIQSPDKNVLSVTTAKAVDWGVQAWVTGPQGYWDTASTNSYRRFFLKVELPEVLHVKVPQGLNNGAFLVQSLCSKI